MTFYTFVLFMHILGVLGMFIAIGLEEAALLRIRSAKTTMQVSEWMRVMSGVEKLFPLSGVLILVSGLTMVFMTWGWNQAWIDVSLGVLLLTSVLSPTLTTPRFKAIRKAVETAPSGMLSSTQLRLTHDSILRTTIFIMDFLTIGVVFLMTMKPGWIVSLAVMAIALVTALIVAQLPMGSAHNDTVVAQPSQTEAQLEEIRVN